MGVKDTANLALIPAAYKTSKVYSALPTDGDGDFTFTRSGSGTRINKAGLIETMATNVPRLNYRLDADGNVSSCPELLLEPTRRNLFLNSEDFTNGSWIKTRTTITGNQTTAPDGTNNADLLTGTGTGTSYIYDGVFLYNATYYISIFVKNINGNDFTIQNFTQSGTAVFDLVNKSVTSTSGTISDAKIEQYQNNWFRVSAKITSTLGGANANLGFGVKDYNGEQFYIWGAQVEDDALGGSVSYTSSYIPTTTAAVTRNKDEAIRLSTDATPTAYPFTVMVQMRIETGKKGFGFSLLNRYANYLYFTAAYCEISANNRFRFSNRNNGTTYSVQPSAEYFEGLHKVAIKFVSETNFKAYINGIEVANLTHTASAFDTNNNTILLGQLRTVTDTNDRNPIKEFFVWHKALTDAEMIEVTSYTSFTEMATQQQYTIQ